MGANAHGKIIEYVNQLNPKTVFLEIGSDNPPRREGSTETIFKIAKAHKCIMYSVDASTDRHSVYKRELADVYNDPAFNLITDFGETFMKDYYKWEYPKHRKISFAYLDGFDWMYNPELYWEHKEPEWQHQQFLEYQKNGIELNNTNSSISHLIQTMLIEEVSDEKAIILYDDTWFSKASDTYIGKGGASIYYLLVKGWKVLPFTRDNHPGAQNAIMLGKNIIPNVDGTIH